MKNTCLYLVAVWLGVTLLGCGDTSDVNSEPPTQVVYFDTQSRQPVVAPPADEIPAVHPKTGKRTLQPALYCQKCQRWHPAPPLDVRQRNPAAGKCAKCQTVLTTDGPIPE